MVDTVNVTYQDSSLVPQTQLSEAAQALEPEIKRVAQALKEGYATDYASIHLPYDGQLFDTVQALIKQKKALQPTMLIVVGIGGSNLGTAAVHQALNGTLYNEQQPATKIYFADTVDSDYMFDLCELVDNELSKGGNVLLNVVSKSGTTTETIANFELLLYLLQEYKKNDYKRYVVVTTDKNSKLWHLANQEGFSCLEIPEKVGGRYSVLSAVGLFPLGLIGVDLKQLLEGAREAVKQCTVIDKEHNVAAISASLLYAQYAQGISIHDTFLFSVDLEGIGRWYRQLTGESIGKEQNRQGAVVHVGITPTVSVGSTDLHSVGQLYLGGPRDKFTSFITVKTNRTYISVPTIALYEQLVEKIQGRPLIEIMDAIVQGTQTAYKNDKRPFMTWQLAEKNALNIGYLLQCKMLEIIYLGFLLDINPFDQPNVESYKKETRKILAHG